MNPGILHEQPLEPTLLRRPANGLLQLLDWLTRPHPSLKSELDRRRSQLLAGMMGVIVAVGVIGLSVHYLLKPAVLAEPDYWLYVAGVLLVATNYGINRWGRVNLAAWVFIGIMIICFGVIPFVPGAIYDFVFFAVVPILVTAIFFSMRATILVMVSMMAWIAIQSFSHGRGQALTVTFYLVMAGGVIYLFIQHLHYQEKLRSKELKLANQRLRASEESLELRVIERTRELEIAKARAEKSDQVKSAFLASMSHELRTPLNAIINFTKFVAKGAMGPVNAEQVETLNEVIDSAKHLLNLINDVLDMSKIEAGSLKLFIEPNVDLNSMLKTLAATGKTLLGDKPVDLQLDIAADLPTIQGDRQRILQILLNVLSNACKFTEAGSIRIGANAVGDEVIFVIEDTGPGIAPEDQALVFEAFKQTETGLRQGGGTGLGMPISRSLVEAHGGRLWLESKPGKGSSFYVALPLQAQKPELADVVSQAR